jgi:hypothetical protein
MTLKQLWSILRGGRTNYRLFGISWTYYPDGDPIGKRDAGAGVVGSPKP